MSDRAANRNCMQYKKEKKSMNESICQRGVPWFRPKASFQKRATEKARSRGLFFSEAGGYAVKELAKLFLGDSEARTMDVFGVSHQCRRTQGREHE